jgi:ferredoxin
MKAYNKLLIYYFSGTGNAKHVSNWISEVAREKQISTEVIDISIIDRKNISPPPAGALIGFCSPTHGFNFPPVMIHFIFRFPRANKNKVFLINTRAGIKVSKIFLPGLSGATLLFSSLVLFFKGFRIIGMRSIDLPSNWISLHPGLNQKVIDSLFARCKKISIRFADIILEGKRNYQALWELPIDLLIAPISMLYYCFGRFYFAKSFYATKSCNNCGICIKQCPVKAIRLVDNRPYWSYKCESCMHCMNNCPENAIETAHGYIIGLLIFVNAIMQSIFYKWLIGHNILLFTSEAEYAGFSRLILKTIISFAALFGSYVMIHYLRRIKIFDMLITYTSLTVYKFWGRYKPSKL